MGKDGAAGPRPETGRPPGERGSGKAALLLNGGGISAAAWEVGCLAALDQVFGPGFCSRSFDIHIGVSAGAVIAALTANGVLPSTLRHEIVNDRDGGFNFKRTDIYRLDYRHAVAKGWEAMRRFVGVLGSYRREGIEFSIFDLIDVAQELLPSGVFSLAPLQEYLEATLGREGLSDRFHDLQRELYVPAIDLDRGERVVFGEAGERDVRISEAVTASCAIPAFFRPYRIGTRSFIDGCMGGHCHVDVAVEHGATLLVVVNPLVPIRCEPERPHLASATGGPCTVAELGISFVGDQAVRILSRERLGLAIDLCRRARPDVDVVLIEPSRTDPLLFLNGPMSFQARNRILQHGYETTLAELSERRLHYGELFSRHGAPPLSSPAAPPLPEPRHLASA
jgi:predicted acylesterase/phospholipase RssA